MFKPEKMPYVEYGDGYFIEHSIDKYGELKSKIFYLDEYGNIINNNGEYTLREILVKFFKLYKRLNKVNEKDFNHESFKTEELVHNMVKNKRVNLTEILEVAEILYEHDKKQKKKKFGGLF